MNQERQSSTDRLSKLPEVFSVDEFKNSQHLSAKAVSVYLARWKSQNLIKSLGPRCGMWVNLKKTNPSQASWQQRLVAIQAKHPDGIIFGANAAVDDFSTNNDLESKTEPTNHTLSLIVPQTSSKAQLEGVQLYFIPNKIYNILSKYTVLEKHGLQQLSKPAALVEILSELAFKRTNTDETTWAETIYSTLNEEDKSTAESLKKQLESYINA